MNGIKVTNLSENEIEQICREIGDSFYDHAYGRKRGDASGQSPLFCGIMLLDNTELSDEKINELVDTFMNTLPVMLKTQLQAA